MFGKKRQIEALKQELALKDKAIQDLRLEMQKSEMKHAQEYHEIVLELNKAKLRLREIQDKSNARTRKCREAKKAAKQK